MQQLDTRSLGHCTVTTYRWNNKYLLKFELAGMEQTYKIAEFDVTGPEEVLALVDRASFVETVMQRFDDMQQDLLRAME